MGKKGGSKTTERQKSPVVPEQPVRAPVPEVSTSAPVAVAATKPSGFATLLLHLHPKMVPEESLRLNRTFGLGGIALLLFFILIVTGALLMFVYDPSTDRAYASVVAIRDEVPFGSFLRAIHHWAANGLLLVSFLHLLRVYFTGAYLPPRRFNWVLGLLMLILIMGGNFTGYLLPWDQLAYWAVTIGTGMLQYIPFLGDTLMQFVRGGAEVGTKTLPLFFVVHIALLPILLFLLTSFHFWKVRKAGGVLLRRAGAERPALVPAQPNLTLREGVAALIVIALLVCTAAVLQAPLGDQANPGLSPNPARAPWYFMGIQELLIHIHPVFAVVIVPALSLMFLAGFPFVRYDDPHSGEWFHSDRGRRIVIWAAVCAVVVASIAVVLDEYVLHWVHIFPGVAPMISTGVVPLVFWGLICSIIVGILTRASTRIETVQGAVTFLIAAFLTLTAIGVFFRGESMRLVWP